ncbi:hypothetical protein [Micromonospora sp. NPDC002575]|uniref:hypothetical protein n=1 Tax=Micromonospora sp. NPDC002575 TaxID=3364222 RepID=UPI0036BEE5A1
MTSRAALATGASRGIGRALADRFAAGGNRVAVHWLASAAEWASGTIVDLDGASYLRA